MNDQIYQITYRVRRIAAHAGLPQRDLARVDQIAASVKREYPAEQGLTAKNRRLVEHLDEPGFVRRLLTLPATLAEAAKRAPDKRQAASLARDAVAVELLISCSMRIGNLDLRLGESIRRFGEGREMTRACPARAGANGATPRSAVNMPVVPVSSITGSTPGGSCGTNAPT